VHTIATVRDLSLREAEKVVDEGEKHAGIILTLSSCSIPTSLSSRYGDDNSRFNLVQIAE